MSAVLILLSLAALCLGIFGWLWVCAGFRRGGWRGAAGIAALQVSGLSLAYGVMRGQPLTGLYMAMFPPLALAQGMAVTQFPALLTLLVRAVALWAAAAAVLVLALAIRPLRVWAPGLALASALVGGVVLGDRIVEDAMCQAAARRGINAFNRMGFAESLTRDWERPLTPHAMAETGAMRLGWSYRMMDWYELPAGGAISPPDLAVSCID